VATELALAIVVAIGGVAVGALPGGSDGRPRPPGWVLALAGVAVGAGFAVAALLRREVVIDAREGTVRFTQRLGAYPLRSRTHSLAGVTGVDVITQEAHERRARGGGGKVFVPPQSWIVLRHAGGDISLAHHWVYASRAAARRAAKPLVERFGFPQLFEEPDLQLGDRAES
jgi:hypothetical protein